MVKFWGLGNAVMLLPAARALKERYPGSKVDFLTLTNNKEISSVAGIFDAIHTIDNSSLFNFIPTASKTLFALKKRKYDLILDFEQFARFSALLCAFMGGKTRIGFNTPAQHRQFLYTGSVKYNNMHITKSFYQLAELAGVDRKQDFRPELVELAGVDSKQGFLSAPLFCSGADLSRINRLLFESGVSRKDFLKKLPCSPCITNYNAKINKCWHPKAEGACMQEISVDEVLAEIETKYLGHNRKYSNPRWVRDECAAGVN